MPRDASQESIITQQPPVWTVDTTQVGFTKLWPYHLYVKAEIRIQAMFFQSSTVLFRWACGHCSFSVLFGIGAKPNVVVCCCSSFTSMCCASRDSPLWFFNCTHRDANLTNWFHLHTPTEIKQNCCPWAPKSTHALCSTGTVQLHDIGHQPQRELSQSHFLGWRALQQPGNFILSQMLEAELFIVLCGWCI